MYNENIPTDRELPSTKKLIKSTIIAAVAAAILLVTIVMPAEYGIDPTGVGKIIGLQKMGEIKVSLAEEANQDNVADAVESSKAVVAIEPEKEVKPVEQYPASNSVVRNDEVTLSLAPNEAAEIKVDLKKGQKVHYEWLSTGKINFDNHGDSKEHNIRYHPYSKGVSTASDKGVIEAAFDGSHGWFWRNRGKETVTLTLTINGEYSDIKRVD